MDEMTNEELGALIAERDYAEAHGLYDTIENPQELRMTDEQMSAMAQAMSTLSDLARETNSSLSDLIAKYSK
jgi:hypothetical protein